MRKSSFVIVDNKNVLQALLLKTFDVAGLESHKIILRRFLLN